LQVQEQSKRQVPAPLTPDVDMTFFVKCGEGVDQGDIILSSRRLIG
jgi:hypothetical protein